MSLGYPFIVSVIIPAARIRLVPELIERLCQQTIGYENMEIIIVCNEGESLAITIDKICFIPVAKTTNAPTRRNIGMDAARGEIFLFLDDDCLPLPNLVERHLDWHHQDRKIVGGSVTFTTDSYLQLADNVSAFHDLLTFTAKGERPYLVTANMSVHRSVVEKVGFMRTDLDRADDLEWTARFRKHGYSLFFDPQAIVIHDPPRTSWQTVWQHWITDAPDTIRVRLQYAQLLQTPRLANYRSIFLWGAPAVALWATWRTFSHAETRHRFWHTLPMVYLTKIAWCLSAFAHFPSNGESQV